jgi:hypothetical protein
VIFKRAEPGREYRALRLVSEEGRWELGLSPYQSGIRLRMGPMGRPPAVMDFCLGHDERIYASVLLAVTGRLEPIPESASAKEIDKAFPWAGTRPDLAIHLQPLIGTHFSEHEGAGTKEGLH